MDPAAADWISQILVAGRRRDAALFRYIQKQKQAGRVRVVSGSRSPLGNE
jgi:hypothetical protein